MFKVFCRNLILCAPLLVTGCGDVNAPTVPSPKIAVTAITPTSVSLVWGKAADTRTATTALVYKVYLSGPNPTYQSFDTIGEVEAGTLVQTLTDASSVTISAGITAGNAYYFNIVVLDEEGNKALYDPVGEYFHTNQVSYYPFNGSTADITATANHLVLAVDLTLPGLALPTVTSDRFGYTFSAYNFVPTAPQCLQSTATVGITINSNRSVSFWVKSSNAPAGTTRAAFAWGDESANGSSFGFFENGVGNNWTVWLAGTANVPTLEVVTSNWEHWVISSAGSSVYTYKNGVLVNNGVATTVNTVDSLLYVGCGMVASALGYPYQGNIDDVRIFNQLLTGTDVANLYAATRP